MSLTKKWKRFFYLTAKGSIDPDSEWRQQNEQHQKNQVYKMVNFSGGGTLIEEYDKGKNSLEKHKLVLEYFDKNIALQCLCADVELVTEDRYQSWHNEKSHLARDFMQQKDVHRSNKKNQSSAISCITDNAKTENSDSFSVVSLDSVVSPYIPHNVKWKLNQRGAIGETPLHLLFLNGSEKHIAIAESLLSKYPELAMDIYEGCEYYGETCLHFAIIQSNFKAVDILLQTGKVDLHARARGKFFIPVDIKRGDVKLRKHKFEGYAYYGEYPLSFAASLDNKKIYDKLITSGCDPNRVDRYGNGVLHLTVIHDQPDMYYHALKHFEQPANPDAMNNDGLTPLSLAAKLGKTEMFKKILEISSRHYWSYNTVTCSAYPLKQLDTIGQDGETDWNSALMMIVRGRKKSHLDMLNNHVVDHLLNEKWKKFGQAKFFRIFLLFLFHVSFLTCSIYLRPNDVSDLRYGQSASDIARYIFEILVLSICCFVIIYAIREIYLESFYGYWQNLQSIPSRLLYTLSACLILLCVPMRFLELFNVEVWLLVFAVPGLWSYMLFFLRTFSLTGPFISMIFRIVQTDLIKFSVIYIIVLLTCAVAFFYQFEGQDVFSFLTELGTFMTLFQMSFGEFDYTSILQGKYQALAIIMFIVFMIFVHILLLNMLIAMITRTFEITAKQAEKVWRRQWASMVVTLERSHKKSVKLSFQQSYDINIQSNRVTSEGDAEHRTAWNKDIALDNRALLVVYKQQQSETQRKKETKDKLLKVSHLISNNTEFQTPPPKFQIMSMTGLNDIIRDAPNEEEDHDFQSQHNKKQLSYSDDEDEVVS